MSEITYHTAHAPYMEAVVEALEAAGVGVEDWFADANDPRDGCITLAERAEDGDARYVAWDEEKGWLYGLGPEGGPINLIWWICVDILPTPSEVVEAVGACVAKDYSKASIRHGNYRWFEDDEDGFEERLAGYHPKAEAVSGEGEGR